MARGGGGPDSAGPGGMGADAFGGDRGGGGSSAGPSGRGGRSLGEIGASARSGGPSLSMDGRATPAELDAMDIMDDVDRAKAVRDAQAAINQARDIARANAVREAQRNIALAQAQQNALREAQAVGLIGRPLTSPVDIDKTLRSYAIQNVRETPVKTGMVMGPYKQGVTPTALQNELGIPFGYSEFEGPAISTPNVSKGAFRDPPFATRSLTPTKAGLFGPSFKEMKTGKVEAGVNKRKQAALDKEVIDREKELLDQMKELLDKGLMNLFSKEYGQLAKALRNLRQSQRYKITIGRKKGMKALQAAAGFALPVPGLGTVAPMLQEKAIEMGFIDDTPLSEIEGMDFEPDGGGQVIIDEYPIS